MISFKDNFLPTEYFKKFQNIINSPLEPSFNGQQKNIGFRKNFLFTDPNFEKFILTIENNFPITKKLKPFDNQISLHLRHNTKEPLAHLDDAQTQYNLIFYLKGESLVNNGTGFYHNNELTAHISFVENRAIFFKGNEIWHTNLQSFGPSSPRYTLLIFYE
jgi:hypothetical protein|tara:strand:+ start:4787 stop:5269 length:483 start_codon:yes stop_codon:yes gene_type:complete